MNFGDSQIISKQPFFNGSNYRQWKVKMTTFIQSLDYNIWDIIVFGPEFPLETTPNHRIRYDEKKREMLKLNGNAKHIIFCALSSNEFDYICLCDSTKEIWDRLEDAHKSSNQELKSAPKNIKKTMNKD
ncbi:DUF4219 domain-containing protein [Cephalotus follicularis]|uniref:DUF4219 domain-containing protein n=1 Tax=Cephalotus follicularis TaxID=3775 RepID=A0A1Q3BDY6_CEPFO|nr:DUF4219 domain-containing protein [Cephalotus follicularis]